MMTLAAMRKKRLERLRIGFVLGELGIGGAERQLLKKIAILQDQGVDCFVVTLSSGGDLTQAFAAEKIRLHEIPRGHSLEVSRMWNLIGILLRERPTIVHGELYDAGAYARIASMMAGVPIRIQAIRSTYPRLNPKYRLAEEILKWFTDAYIVNAAAIKRRTIELHRVNSKKVHVVYNLYDATEAPRCTPDEMRRELGLVPGRKVIGLLGSFSPEKNHELFLRFARALIDRGTDAEFMLIGDGKLRPKIEAQIAQLDLGSRVRLLGLRRDVPDLLQVLDISVNCSFREGLNNAILESLALGIPVLGSHVGGTPELVETGVNGETFESDSLDDMIAKAEMMIPRIEEYRARIRENRGDFLQRFQADEVTRQTLDIYLKCLSNRGFELESPPHAH